MLGTQNFQYLPTYQPAFLAPESVTTTQPLFNNIPTFGLNSTLTHIQPTSTTTPNNLKDCQPIYRKRGSFEMEEDEHFASEPPTKQILSESKLFTQFGSLQIDPSQTQSHHHGAPLNNMGSDETVDHNEKALTLASTADDSREEFKRYIYLLYMDRNRNNPQSAASSATPNPSFSFDNLLREEREKLTKAVVLWNPSIQSGGSQENNSDSDEDFAYTDHRDFLKYSSSNTACDNTSNSVVITEVTDDDFEMMATDDTVQPNTATPHYYEPDDVMIL